MGNGKRVREVMERENGLEILSTDEILSTEFREWNFVHGIPGKAGNQTGGRTHYGIESSILRRRDSSPLIHHAHKVAGNYRHLNHPSFPCIIGTYHIYCANFVRIVRILF